MNSKENPNYKKIKEISLDLSKLIVSKNNPRVPTLNSEQEAIDFFCSKKQEKSTKKLINSILDNGLFPELTFYVNKITDNIYEVLDGNRRLTAIKILNDPNLISNNIILKQYCLKKNKEIKKSLNGDFKCNHCLDKDHCRKIIKFKHTEGNAELAWPKIAQIKFMLEDKSYNPPKWYSLINKHRPDFLNDATFSNKSPISTVARIFTVSNIEKYIPIDDKFEFKHENSKNILNKILDDIKKGGLDTRKLNKKEQKQEYWTNLMNIKNNISNVKIENTEDMNNQQKNLNNSFENKNENVKQGENFIDEKSQKNIKVEKYRLGELKITNKKLENNDFQGIRKLYDEIKTLKYKPFNKNQRLYEILPIATFSLIRALYEQLLKFYLKTYFCSEFDKLFKKNNKLEQNIKLSDIINKIVNLISQNKTIFNKNIDNDFKTLSNNSNNFLNMIMHNPSLYNVNSTDVEKYASGFIYNLFKFILNKQE